ncbi:precorrin-6y C5,15-methyltransferase (decarboxylating) subunit CbiE [Streptacidiphilus albus]|uniref:precorrin-6y C5,15-methyltransferase (decarboxylating) subunit CbiE n=1 Tax=Streptacidiphilus albus TaxID=105425 RepID=UPI0007C7E01E|nr:precorrin-6y C5,15-methyltransferase (decarboxylating) subunit CbiE [Streptacidiphilus albus]
MADRVTVIGWDGSPLSQTAQSALDAATLVAGGSYQLQNLRLSAGAERMALGSVTLVARRIADHRGTAVVVAEGDPGFFGVVRTLRRPEYGLELEVLPAVSSVAAAFARAGMPWDDAQVVSTHGRGLRRAANVCRAHPKVAVLTSPGAGPSELALMLRDVHRTFVICEALGTPDEEITVLTSDRVPDHLWRDPNVVIVIGGGPMGSDASSGWLAGRPLGFPGTERGWAAESVWRPGPTGGQASAATSPSGSEARAEVRAEAVSGGAVGAGLPAAVRALVMARLGPRPGDLLWDVEAGDGALSVDAARAGAAVLAVERDADACARIDVSARHHGVDVRTVHGSAPAVLADLPEPDVVLVRGDVDVLRACLGRRPERIVALPRTLRQVEAVRQAMGEVGYTVDGALIQSSPLSGLVGAGAAADRTSSPIAPVFVLWGDR